MHLEMGRSCSVSEKTKTVEDAINQTMKSHAMGLFMADQPYSREAYDKNKAMMLSKEELTCSSCTTLISIKQQQKDPQGAICHQSL